MADSVLVIGGGAAGCRAACAAAELGAEVTLLERNAKIGRKVMITGKGRCNVTNARYDLQEILSHIPTNPTFLYSALAGFMPQDTMDLFESLGVPLKIERGNRVFPVSDKAVDIVDAMERDLRRHHVHRVHARAAHLVAEDGRIRGAETEHGNLLPADAVILSTGGGSYPRTGSTGDGYRMAQEIGHTVTPLSPSLVPMISSDPCCRELNGLNLRNIAIQVSEPGVERPVYEDFGELQFTPFGVSGPTILSASSHIRRIAHPLTLTIDLKPALSEEQLDARIQRDFHADLNREFRYSLGKLLPRKLIPVIISRSGIDPEKPLHQITREEREHLLQNLKAFSLPLTGFRPLSEAIVTSGGISVKEIDPHSMQSRLVDGLFFAGEIIDVDGYTGGYNLQIAFATGTMAGQHAVYF